MTRNSTTLLPAQAGPSTSQYYSHSGIVPIPAAIAGIVGGLLTAILSGIAYAYADLYSPVDKLNAILALLFGAILGAVPAVVMRRAKARNTKVVVLVALLMALVGYYVCWVAWICAVFDRFSEHLRSFSVLDVVTHPAAMERIILHLNKVGTWSTSASGEAEHGVMLWIIWGCEALAIFGAAIGVAAGIGAGEPFCETCNAWCGKEEALATLDANDIAGLKQRLESRDFVALAADRKPASAHHVALSCYHCANCGQLHVLSAAEITIRLDKKGRSHTKKRVLANKLLVTPDELDVFKAPPARPAPVASPESSVRASPGEVPVPRVDLNPAPNPYTSAGPQGEEEPKIGL